MKSGVLRRASASFARSSKKQFLGQFGMLGSYVDKTTRPKKRRYRKDPRSVPPKQQSGAKQEPRDSALDDKLSRRIAQDFYVLQDAISSASDQIVQQARVLESALTEASVRVGGHVDASEQLSGGAAPKRALKQGSSFWSGVGTGSVASTATAAATSIISGGAAAIPIIAAMGLKKYGKSREGLELRSQLRALLGIPDDPDPDGKMPWEPGGQWDKERAASAGASASDTEAQIRALRPGAVLKQIQAHQASQRSMFWDWWNGEANKKDAPHVDSFKIEATDTLSFTAREIEFKGATQSWWDFLTSFGSSRRAAAGAQGGPQGGAGGSQSWLDYLRNFGRSTPSGPGGQQRGSNTPDQGAVSTDGKQVPPEVLSKAEALARQGGGSAEVQQFMAQQGYPMRGNWCGEFAAAVVKSAGGAPPRNPAIASNWLKYGEHTDSPVPGDVMVRKTNRSTGAPLEPGQVGGHVGFFTGRYDKLGRPIIAGGNGGVHPVNPSDYEFRHVEEKKQDAAKPDAAKTSEDTQKLVDGPFAQSTRGSVWGDYDYEKAQEEIYKDPRWREWRRSGNVEDDRSMGTGDIFSEQPSSAQPATSFSSDRSSYKSWWDREGRRAARGNQLSLDAGINDITSTASFDDRFGDWGEPLVPDAGRTHVILHDRAIREVVSDAGGYTADDNDDYDEGPTLREYVGGDSRGM